MRIPAGRAFASAPGGHGTQFGAPIPTISEPEEAEDFIDARLAEGSDYIKIVVEDGSAFGMTTPTLDEATVRALVSAAHARGVKAVVHVGDYDAALVALRSGADGMVHIFADRSAEADFGRRAAAQGVFVVPTLTVLEATAGGVGGLAVIEDPVLGPRPPACRDQQSAPQLPHDGGEHTVHAARLPGGAPPA